MYVAHRGSEKFMQTRRLIILATDNEVDIKSRLDIVSGKRG